MALLSIRKRKVVEEIVAPVGPRKLAQRTRAPDHEEPHSLGKLLPARQSGATDRCLRRSLQQPPLSREPEQRHSGRRLLRT